MEQQYDMEQGDSYGRSPMHFAAVRSQRVAFPMSRITTFVVVVACTSPNSLRGVVKLVNRILVVAGLRLRGLSGSVV